MSLLDLAPGGRRSAERAPSGEAAAVLARLGGVVGSLLPAALLFYVFLIWPLAFADSTSSPIEDQLGWLAPFDNGGGESPWKQVAYPVFFMIALFGAVATAAYRRVPLTRPDLLALAGIAALALVSAAWSVEPRQSLMRATLLAIILATIVLSVYAASSFRLMMQAVFAVFAVTAAANLAGVVLLPATAIGHAGIYAQKNVLGTAAAIILFFGLAYLFRGGWPARLAALAMVGAAVILLVLSQSKTSLGLAVAVPFAAAALAWLARRSLSPAVVVPVVVAALVVIFLLGATAGSWDLYTLNAALFGDPTLTGRTDIWRFAAGLIAERPLLGWGYEAIWGLGYEGVAYSRAIGFPRVAPTGHNGYVDIVLYTGLPGAVALAAAIVAVLGSAGRLARIDGQLGWLALMVVIFTLLHNNFESDLFISSNNLSMLVVIFHVAASRLARS